MDNQRMPQLAANEDRILLAIAEMRQDITGRLDSMEARLGTTERKTKKIRQVQMSQGEQIERLKQEVRSLMKSNAVVWKREGRTGLDPQSAYQRFRDADISSRSALRTLENIGYLEPEEQGRHRTKVVRIHGTVSRVIVILDDAALQDEVEGCNDEP